MRIFKLWDSEKKGTIEVEAKKNGRQWITTCPKPNCPDREKDHDHLYIDEEKGVYYCQMCNWGGHLYNPNYKGKNNRKRRRRDIVRTYDYQDEKGNLLFQVVKYCRPKKFVQRRPDGKGGWIWNIKGVRRVLYRLPELLNGPDPVYIVEGEKDADNLWNWELTATTSPMGAGKWRKEYNKFLKNREVILIPDHHKKGYGHMEKVGNDIYGIAEKIKWLELPGLSKTKGEDVSDWQQKGGTREKLLKLSSQAPEYDPNRKVYQQACQYNKRDTGPITNFTIIPQVRVQTKDGEFLKAKIITNKDKTYQVQFTPDAWISRQKFKRALRGLLDLEYRGTDNDIQDIKGILASQNPPIKQGVKTTGMHQIGGKWLYIEEEIAQDRDGKREDVIYLPENPYRVSLLENPLLTSSQLDEILSSLFEFNSEDVVYPLLGFCFACFVKERMVNEIGVNPILVCWGEKGSGKTATLEHVIKPIFGIQASIENIAHPTEFAFARIISSSNLAPILFDEHKPGKISQIQRDRISEMFRSVYNRSRLTRGKPDFGFVEFVYTAPVVVAGEMGLSELALKDRVVETYFSKKKIEGRKNPFVELTHLPLAALGKDFLLWVLKLEDEEIKDIWQAQLENVDEELTDRLRKNTAYARLGLALFLNYLVNKGRKPKKFEEGFDIIDQAQKTNILQESNKSLTDAIIEAFSVMVEHNKLEEGEHFKIDSNMELKLHLSTIYPLFKKWAKDYLWDGEVLDKISFIRQIKEARYFKIYKTARIGEEPKKVHILNLSQMKHLNIEGFTENTS